MGEIERILICALKFLRRQNSVKVSQTDSRFREFIISKSSSFIRAMKSDRVLTLYFSIQLDITAVVMEMDLVAETLDLVNPLAGAVRPRNLY
jgi:hypothetical protein